MCACAVNPWAGGQVLSRKKPFLEYLSETLNKFDLRKHIRFGENLESARFSSDNSEWTLGIRDMETQLRCTFLVFCTGYFKYGTCRAISLLACIMISSSFAHLVLASPQLRLHFRAGLHPEVPGSGELQGRDRSSAEVECWRGLQRQESRGHRQWRDRSHTRPRHCRHRGLRHHASKVTRLLGEHPDDRLFPRQSH